MGRHLKKEIQKALEAPDLDQRKKAEFLRTVPRSRIRMGQFLVMQIAYIRTWVLLLSVFLLFPVMGGAYYVNRDALWMVSAFIPVLGLLAVTESTRSVMYGMSEFELSARFSLKSVMLSRMCILGLLDLIVLCCTAPLCCISSHVTLLQMGLYLLVPYLLTVNISLYLVRHFYGREAVYACMSAAALVSGADWGLHAMADYVYQWSYVHWWIVLSVLLLGRMVQGIVHTIKQTEEWIWN